jgi:hypothetical protein
MQRDATPNRPHTPRTNENRIHLIDDSVVQRAADGLQQHTGRVDSQVRQPGYTRAWEHQEKPVKGAEGSLVRGSH